MTTSTLALNFGAGLVLRRFAFDFTDLTAAALTQTFNLFTLSAGSKILGVGIQHTTPFAGHSIASCTLSVGSAVVGADGFASAFDVKQAAAATTLQETELFKSGTSAAQVVTATFTTTTDYVNLATAGNLTIDVLVADVSTPLPITA